MKNLYAKLKLTNNFPYSLANSNYTIIDEYTINCPCLSEDELSITYLNCYIKRDSMIEASYIEGLNLRRINYLPFMFYTKNGKVKNMLCLGFCLNNTVSFHASKEFVYIELNSEYEGTRKIKLRLRDFSLVKD